MKFVKTSDIPLNPVSREYDPLVINFFIGAKFALLQHALRELVLPGGKYRPWADCWRLRTPPKEGRGFTLIICTGALT